MTTFSADLSCVTDGRIQCPVVVIASTGDTLFPYGYTVRVVERIRAPRKEVILLNEPYHLVFNECVDRIVEPGVEKLTAYSR